MQEGRSSFCRASCTHTVLAPFSLWANTGIPPRGPSGKIPLTVAVYANPVSLAQGRSLEGPMVRYPNSFVFSRPSGHRCNDDAQGLGA
jgi:hypothetical protein